MSERQAGIQLWKFDFENSNDYVLEKLHSYTQTGQQSAMVLLTQAIGNGKLTKK